MALRREIMNYIGTGAVGGIIGYYVGAQGLLGIQSKEVVRTVPEDEEQPPENQDQPQDSEDQNNNDTFDDFEDTSQLNWVIIDGARSDLSFSDQSAQGSYSLYFNDTNTTTTIRKSLPSSTQVDSFSFWFKYSSQNDNQWRFGVFNENGDPAIQFWNYFTDINISYPNGDETVADIEQEKWFQVIASDIDYQSNTMSAEVKDESGNSVGSKTGLNFKNDSETIQFVQIRDNLDSNGGADPLWIDEVRVNTI